MLNSSTTTPNDAELQDANYYGESFNIPVSQEVREYVPHHHGAEQDADFARWTEEVKPGAENDFVLGYDEIDPDLFGSDEPKIEHGNVGAIEAATQTKNDDERTRATIEKMAMQDQVKLIINTGVYFVPNVRKNTIIESRK